MIAFFTLMYLTVTVIHNPGMCVAFEVDSSQQKQHGMWWHGTSEAAVSILVLQYQIAPLWGPQNGKSKLSQGFQQIYNEGKAIIRLSLIAL